jgi:hypothetical protein
MGLGKVQSGDSTFLSIAGGFIWDRKADKSHECYAEQDYEKADKTTGTRTGAQYGDLTGRVAKVAFRTHSEYGESINVNFIDADGESYTVSISTNNRYSQDMMKALLVMDLEKSITLKPYDFTGSDKKRAQGISFKQDGEKLVLKVEVPEDYTRDEGWFKKADKKQIKRFFEDLNEWFVAEVEEKVVPNIKAVVTEGGTEEKPAPKKTETAKETPKKTESKPVEEKEEEQQEEKPVEKPKVSILAMKKVLNPYIAENYPDESLPTLSPEEMFRWYNLALQEEELPFEETSTDTGEDGELSQEDLDEKLNALMGED